MRSYLLVMVLSAIAVYLSIPAVRGLALRWNAMTALRDRDVHSVPTPRLGGIGMFVGLVVGLGVAYQIPFLHPVISDTTVLGILAGATLVTTVGAIDDLWGLDPATRLAAQCLAGLVLVFYGVQFISLPVLGVTLGSSTMLLGVTVLAVVVTINAVNFIDGLDGLVGGVMAIAGSAFFIYTYQLTRDASPSDYSSLAATVAAILVGICLGFLPHNANPARIFMGDSGAYLVGLLMATSAIVVTGQVDPSAVSAAKLMPAFAPVLLPLAILLIPLTDLGLAVLRRLGRGQSPFAADRGHLHHRLLDMGHSHRGAVVVMCLWAATLSYGAVAVAFLDPPWGAVIAGAAFVISAAATSLPRFGGLRAASRMMGGRKS